MRKPCSSCESLSLSEQLASEGREHDARDHGSCGVSARFDYRVVVYFFGATEAEFEQMQDRILDAVTEALGCTDDPDHECKHFQVGVSGPRNTGRRHALRWALSDLWLAIRHGEV